MSRPARSVGATLLLLLMGVGVARTQPARAVEPVPVMVRTAPGRFEIAAVDASAAHAVSAVAEETWRLLATPFGLPPAFSSPVFVRLHASGEALRQTHPSDGGFGASVEAGGVVSVWIRWPAAHDERSARWIRRALVRGLLLRLAVATHGAPELAKVPGWLETAAVGWCETRSDPARLDALKYRLERVGPTTLANIFAERPGVESDVQLDAASWLLAFLQNESTAAGGEWSTCVRRLLRGETADAALSAAFPGRFASAIERELWWQTGWHHLLRTRALPALDAAESRAELAALARFVFAPEDADVVVPLRRVVEEGRDAIVSAELKRRATELNRLLAALHPFYRNAGLSLAAAFESAIVATTAAKREAACAQFENDWRDALELERETKAALDRMESDAR